MVVGSTGGGKTVIINTLIKAQCHLGLPTKCTVINPKVRIYSPLTIQHKPSHCTKSRKKGTPPPKKKTKKTIFSPYLLYVQL